METLLYRPNVAAIIVNCQRQILACQRADKFRQWQFPQGGIDQGESPEEALRRELEEEVALIDFSILSNLKKPIIYDWPDNISYGGFVGQSQYYFLIKPNQANWSPIFDNHHDVEFTAGKWLYVKDFLPLIKGSFKEKSYLTALKNFNLL